MFDLETALSTWRHYFAQRHGFQKEDLDELERHVRDHVRHAVRQGASEEEAFWEAVREVGDYEGAEEEYQKVYWGKVKRLGRLPNELSWRAAMLKNYLIVSLRNLRRRKAYALINVLGLAVAMACCLLIAAYVRQEMSYDRFHANAGRIYRIVFDRTERDRMDRSAWGAPVLGPTLAAEVPEVEAAVRIMNMRSERLLRYGDRTFWESRIFETDSAFFSVFSFPLLRGNPEKVLAAPNTIVLTESTARKYFGDEDPLGKTLVSNNERPLTVTGIMVDVPHNSHLQFDGLVSMATWGAEEPQAQNNWGYVNLMTYVLLHPGANDRYVLQNLAGVVDRHLGESLREENASLQLQLEPVTDIRLRSKYGGIGGGNSIDNVRLFSVVALFILLIACVNFINLATARSAERAKEVGIRKVVGARRSMLAGQFVWEALLLSTVSFVCAVILVFVLRAPFQGLAGTEVAWRVSWVEAIVVAAAVLGIGALAGVYPALILSGFQPVRVLKGPIDRSGRRSTLRKGLVVTQFAVAVALIAATGVVVLQLSYMQRQHLGFEMHENGELLVIDLPIDGSLQNSAEAVKDRFLRHPDVVAAAASGATPASGGRGWMDGELEREDGTMQPAVPVYFIVDDDFVSVYGMEIAAGRTFSPTFGTDSTAFLLNEAATREYGFTSPEYAVGRRIRIGEREGQVIGVVRDFHIAGLQEKVPSIAVWMEAWAYSQITLRVRPGDIQKTMTELEAAWKELAPAWPFQYRFLDERFNEQYESEIRFGRIFGTFAALAVFVACLGLFGLAAFTAERRTKEIGIRKVLGASAPSIVTLLSKDFLKLVLIAFVLAAPLAYLAMNRWLEDFAYRIELGPGIFLLAGALALLIALATVSYQAVKAALADPVKSLRYE